MHPRISRAALDRILSLASADPDREICGLLLDDGQGGIGAVRPAANVADDPARRFEIDPAVLIAAHRASRQGEPAVIGHYHSHPGGDTRPSACDADMAFEDGKFWLICSPGGAHALWKTGDGGLHGRFLPQQLDIDDPSMPLASTTS
ncbi:MAG: M67 family metallopeptidase [Sphingobium sp.]